MHNPTRLPFIANMMKQLGDEFHLNILPGSFSKPPGLLGAINDGGRNKFGPQVEENYVWLVNYFFKIKNITVHRPVPWGDHWNYLHHSHLGIDFAPNCRKKSIAGNAKLLEYMAAGLPSITERGTGNSELIRGRKFGIVVDSSRDLSEYCDAVKSASKVRYDRGMISRVTISDNNWEKRARDMLRDIGTNVDIL